MSLSLFDIVIDIDVTAVVDVIDVAIAIAVAFTAANVVIPTGILAMQSW